MGEVLDATVELVTHPNHYQLWDHFETMDVIRKTLTTEEFEGFLKGNILKYRLRAGLKDDPAQELKKADHYRKVLNEGYTKSDEPVDKFRGLACGPNQVFTKSARWVDPEVAYCKQQKMG